MTDKIRLAQLVEAGGCSAKLSPADLEKVLGTVPLPEHPDIIVGSQTHDDAGVLRMKDGTYMIQTTDFFPPMVDNPYEFGQVAAANALSDVYAMGGKPITALSLVMFPSQVLSLDILSQMLKGGSDKADEAGALMMGGHTIDDDIVKYGLAVTGTVDPENLATNANAKIGDKLILTKALGTAVLTGARKVDMISELEVKPAVESMIELNNIACDTMNSYKVKGATDVTGFALLGHSFRFADASDVTFRIESSELPVLPKALELIDLGAIPGGAMRNLAFVKDRVQFLPSLRDNLKWLALDPQTSGGLLISVAADKAEDMLDELKGKGLKYSSIVGEVLHPGDKRVLLA